MKFEVGKEYTGGCENHTCVHVDGSQVVFKSNVTGNLWVSKFNDHMKPVAVTHAPALYLYCGKYTFSKELYTSEEEARNAFPSHFVCWPAYKAEWPKL